MDIDVNLIQGSLKDTVQVFKRFKELESKNQQLQMCSRMAEKFEKKCLRDVEKCPKNKNIRDQEIKYKKAKADRETAEIKCEPSFELIKTLS